MKEAVPFPYTTRDQFSLQGDPAVLEILYGSTSAAPEELLHAIASPPPFTSIRVNTLRITREELIDSLHSEWGPDSIFRAEVHPDLNDIVLARCINPPALAAEPSCRKHVILSRVCAEAVCRGAHVYGRGIRALSKYLDVGHPVSVFADVTDTINAGSVPERSVVGSNIILYIGEGVMRKSRAQVVDRDDGVAVEVCLAPVRTCIPDLTDPHQMTALCFAPLPALNGVLPGLMYVQSLPSALVAHVLNPQPGDVVMDLCAAPGSKTTHIAALMRNEGLLVANCLSHSKRTVLIKLCHDFGVGDLVQAIKIDSTQCVLPREQEGLSLATVLDECKRGAKCKGYPRESFDKVLLDPPCTALGLRPRFKIDDETAHDLQRALPSFQLAFAWAAVYLLKPGGEMVYSTCTLNAHENEEAVARILSLYPCLELLPQTPRLGSPGLEGYGLSPEQCALVQRFDPCMSDTPGFFIARFRKNSALA